MSMVSPSSRTQTSPRSYSSAFASTSATNFSPGTYSSANARVQRHLPSSSTSSVRFLAVEQRAKSPVRRSMTVATTTSQTKKEAASSSSSNTESEKKKCMCSPTMHPGSFRCAYHKQLAERQQQQEQRQQQRQQQQQGPQEQPQQQQQTMPLSGRKLNLLRSAMKNSVVRRIGGADGEIVRRALTTLIRPSSHYLHRRVAFQPRPTRLSLMSKAQDQLILNNK
ncbi:probable serine/threonine-protein kinase fhkB [Vigna radiata var. radiata]|uniref:Probable serine/threonine-protein kinase fhkB n=1 Tax=Vigna radiata var. radiata TaxID=3916 RepID=A0A3Q0EWC3_VIGRR|nr:probable serine/threonine-protein kinase fhkB [Vigna radiata var. radiata]